MSRKRRYPETMTSEETSESESEIEIVLPDDILINIFEKLVNDGERSQLLAGAGSVCKRWRNICLSTHSLWQEFRLKKKISQERFSWLFTHQLIFIRNLTICNVSSQFSDEDIQLIIKNCPLLEVLHLQFCFYAKKGNSNHESMKSDLFDTLSQLNNLVEFSVHLLPLYLLKDNKFTNFFVHHSQNLVKLSLSGVSGDMNEPENYLAGLLRLMEAGLQFSNLRSLLLKFQRQLSRIRVSTDLLHEAFPKLTSLELYSSVLVKASGSSKPFKLEEFSFGSLGLRAEEIEEQNFVGEVVLRSRFLKRLQLNGVVLSLEDCQRIAAGSSDSYQLQSLTVNCEEGDIAGLLLVLKHSLLSLVKLTSRNEATTLFSNYCDLVEELDVVPVLNKVITSRALAKNVILRMTELLPHFDILHLRGWNAKLQNTLLTDRDKIIAYCR